MTEIINPITGRPLKGKAKQYVTELRRVRRNALKEARSGNPAKAAPARHAIAQAADLIRRAYIDAARSGQ